MFVNRASELHDLETWWGGEAGRLGLVWGRRRVGKTALVEEFAAKRRSIFHTGASRPVVDELAILSRVGAGALAGGGIRDLAERPFVDWRDALDTFADAARDEPLLLVLDEFPDLVATAPSLPGEIRAFWDRARARSKLRILLSGSAVRTMRAMQEERAPLYGRVDLSLLLHPFRPHEAAQLLRHLKPADRALVWGLTGGMPLYLTWWDQRGTVRENLRRLVGTPGGQFLNEGQLVLATEAESGQLDGQVLRAIAAGRTKHNEIADAVRAEPTRTLDRLIELRLVERLVPVTDDPRRTRRRIYRIADNFLAFWLGVVEPYKAEIERGLGSSIVGVIERSLDDFMGPRWEQAFRSHLRRLAERGDLGDDVVAIGPFWRDEPPVEIDAVALAGRARRAALVGEAKWARTVDGARTSTKLLEKATALPKRATDLQVAVAARDKVTSARGLLAVTAKEVFGD